MTTTTWNQQPSSGDWNTASNWTPAAPPSDGALFSASSVTTITFSTNGNATVGSIEFSADAPAYTFNFGTGDKPSLTVSESVKNLSGKQQSFIVAATSTGRDNPQLLFTGNANAGSDDNYYCAGPINAEGYGGGVISFCDNASAGSARFKVWTGALPPPQYRGLDQKSTVGGEVSFSNNSSADNATFTIYGSLGIDGDTFANVVFHDTATAGTATLVNIGGTVAGGDGGNTQFYGSSTADRGIYNNYGATHSKANGGDVAFDTTSTGAYGRFYNYAAPAAGGYGGVTSFNNNPPHTPNGGASAGNGLYFNFGARQGELGGGGHLEFTARYGSPTGSNAIIENYGSEIENKSSAGHTIFSINTPTDYFPTAGNATIRNHPAVGEKGAAGFTEFSVYSSKNSDTSGTTVGKNVPTAGNATVFNLGGYSAKASGGYTVFAGTSSAGNSTLVAYGGTGGGYGGKIAFYDHASGDSANVQLFGNGELDLSNHTQGVTIGSLELTGGIISVQLGSNVTALEVTGELILNTEQARFSFWTKADTGFAFNTPYTILTSSKLGNFTSDQFVGNSLNGVAPSFSIVGNALQVNFIKP